MTRRMAAWIIEFCRSPERTLGETARSGGSDLAHHASALKQMRQSLKHRARNRKNLSQVRTQIRRLREVVAKGDAAAAKKLLPETVSAIDKAAKKGVIHANAAARYKGRLTQHVLKIAAP